MIRAGTCGFAVAQRRAVSELECVEVQRTFYRPVPVETARRWRDLAPPPFAFAVKASQFITHDESSPTYRRSGLKPPIPSGRYGAFRDTREVRDGWEATRAVAEALDALAIVFQCPPSLPPSPENVRNLYRFFESIDTHAAKVWEPRGPWASHLIDKACADLGLIHGVDPFASEPATAGTAYFRLHGAPPGERMYQYRYTDSDLAKLHALCAEFDDAFAMFNNVTMHADALRFASLVREKSR